MSRNMTALCTCHSCLPNKGNFVWHHTSLDPDSLSRKLKSQSEVVFCLANGLCGLFCALVISDSAPHEIFLEKESGGETSTAATLGLSTGSRLLFDISAISRNKDQLRSLHLRNID